MLGRPTEELTQWWKEQPEPKCKLSTFKTRIRLYGVSREEAITVGFRGRPAIDFGGEGRVCTMCNQYKPRDEFGNCSKYKNGKSHICRECYREKQKSYYHKCKEEFIDKWKSNKKDEDKIVNVRANDCPTITPEMCPGYVYHVDEERQWN